MDKKPARRGERGEVVEQGEPPVVARLVVEIRSDGSRTIARGAMEDVNAGQRVAVQAEGGTPLALATSLAKAIFQAPFFRLGTGGGGLARRAARALLRGRGAAKK